MENIYKNKRDLIKAVKNGDFRFNKEYILEDRRVKNSFGENFINAIRDAVIDYASWQLMVIKNYSHIYGENAVKGVCENIEREFNSFNDFKKEWEKIELLENHERILNEIKQNIE